MFVSAGFDLKVHSSNEEGLENHQVQHPASTSKIINVSICNDNSYIALLRENEKPQIFSGNSSEKVVRLIHSVNISNISALSFKHTTKKHIAMGTTTGDVIIYDTKSRNVSSIYPKITRTIKALDFTCDDQQLCGYDGTTFFVFPQINENDHLNRYKQPSECSSLKCHPFIANRVAIGHQNGHVEIWDVQKGIAIIKVELFASPISGVLTSSCGNFLIASGEGVKICEIDFTTGTCKSQYSLDQEKPVSSVDLSPDDNFLAVGLSDGTLKLYNVKEEMKPIYNKKLHQTPINIIVFENGPREANTNSNFSFLFEHENIEIRSNGNEIPSLGSSKAKDASFEKMKRTCLTMMKQEMDSVEAQLDQHCANLQKFFANEFDNLQSLIKNKLGSFEQVMELVDPDEDESNCE